MHICCFAYLLPHKEPPQAALLLSLAEGRGLAGLRRAALLLILLEVSHVVIRLWLGWNHPRASPAAG